MKIIFLVGFMVLSSLFGMAQSDWYYGENDSDKEKVDAMAPDGKVPTSMSCFLVKTLEHLSFSEPTS